MIGADRIHVLLRLESLRFYARLMSDSMVPTIMSLIITHAHLIGQDRPTGPLAVILEIQPDLSRHE